MDRKEIERDFHDRLRLVDGDKHVADTRWSLEMENTIENNPLWVNMKYYAVEEASRNFVMSWYEKNTLGKHILDYCCGNGEDGIIIAEKWNATVVGIDISEVSIENCQRRARETGVSDRVTHAVGDAEALAFEDGTFDVVIEYGALHHLELDKAFSEMARVLRSGGKAICQEAVGHNPVIHAYRKLTPKLRTSWEVEHILGRSFLEVARKYFKNVEVKHFHLFGLLAVPLRRTFFFRPVLKLLNVIDAFALKIPGFRWMAWQMVIILSDPRK
jgi:ubiquinone/menaquinone biosynthesis C-methylase UbiE